LKKIEKQIIAKSFKEVDHKSRFSLLNRRHNEYIESNSK